MVAALSMRPPMLTTIECLHDLLDLIHSESEAGMAHEDVRGIKAFLVLLVNLLPA